LYGTGGGGGNAMYLLDTGDRRSRGGSSQALSRKGIDFGGVI